MGHKTVALAAELQSSSKKRKFTTYHAAWPYFFIAPFVIILLVFNLFPIIYTFFMSLTNWDGMGKFNIIGFDNYIRALDPKTSRFFMSLENTAIILLMYLPICMTVSLVISEILCGKMVRHKKFLQISFFSPYLVAPIALGIMWSIMFDWKYGTVNRILTLLNLVDKPVNFLGIPLFAQGIMALMLIWKNGGYFVVMMMAGITAIPSDYYEAAEIDGANAFQRFLKITLPLLKPVLTFLTMTSVIYGFQLFDEPFLLFSGGFTKSQPYGGPEGSVLTLVMEVYDAAYRNFRFGFASTEAILMFVVIVITSSTLVYMLNRGGKDEK